MNNSSRIFTLIITTFIMTSLYGCSSSPKKQVVTSLPTVETSIKEDIAMIQPDSSPELTNVDEEDMEGYVQPKGFIFAKTDFQGVLQTSYVKLQFEKEDNPEIKFQLHIGEKGGQAFPWDVKVVKPGYFFIELPAGPYNVTSVSIPVGSTIATEDIDLSLNVVEENITYIGTLKLNGTKEKIRLGGVPVIKPGFEYTAEVIDEIEEANLAFSQKYPNIETKVTTQLMTLHAEETKLE